MQLNLSRYSMGFLELFSSDRVELRGSGTLLRIGNTYGILTAAHVWQVVRELEIVGIYLYPPRSTEMHSIWEEVRLMDAVTFENRDEDEYGPDLAFIRIRKGKAVSIELHGAFLSFEKDEQRVRTETPEGSKVVDVVVGGVEAMGQKVNMRHDRKLIVQRSLAIVGRATVIDDGREGFDRLELIPESDADFEAPQSYGGMSGGGCFRVYFPEKIRR